MKAPNKIYLHPDIGDREFIRSWGVRAVTTDAVCYINKDLLLEWLEARVYEHNEDKFDDGFNTAIGQVIDKINSL